MEEYELSFEVKDIVPYIEYCKKNGYILVEEGYQERTIYRKDDGTMARITVNKKGDIIKNSLDFKEDKLTDNVLNVRKESLPIEFNDFDSVNSILAFLNYKKDNTLIRKRHTFEKEKVKFELDEYTQPKIANIVAIEGDKNLVDKVYDEIKELFFENDNQKD